MILTAIKIRMPGQPALTHQYNNLAATAGFWGAYLSTSMIQLAQVPIRGPMEHLSTNSHEHYHPFNLPKIKLSQKMVCEGPYYFVHR